MPPTSRTDDVLPYGLYEALLDEGLRQALSTHPELKAVLGKLDPEEQPSRYAAFVGRVIEQALRQETDAAARLDLCNHLIRFISETESRTHLRERILAPATKPLLLE
jgi:hypothetical protein